MFILLLFVSFKDAGVRIFVLYALGGSLAFSSEVHAVGHFHQQHTRGFVDVLVAGIPGPAVPVFAAYAVVVHEGIVHGKGKAETLLEVGQSDVVQVFAQGQRFAVEGGTVGAQVEGESHALVGSLGVDHGVEVAVRVVVVGGAAVKVVHAEGGTQRNQSVHQLVAEFVFGVPFLPAVLVGHLAYKEVLLLPGLLHDGVVAVVEAEVEGGAPVGAVVV